MDVRRFETTEADYLLAIIFIRNSRLRRGCRVADGEESP
jgi:hypothetical protein